MPAVTDGEPGDGSIPDGKGAGGVLTAEPPEPVAAPDPAAVRHDPLTHFSPPVAAAVAVAGALAVAAGIVLRFVVHSPLWLDEALTVNIAKLPLHDLHGALQRDGAPPLFYVLLHFWMGAFGTSAVSVRAISGVLSVATLPVAWVAAARYGGRTVAWVTVLLLASAPFAIFYATESRMYALVMFLTACGFAALERALRRPRPGNLVALGLSTAGLLYSQYWALYLVATVGLWLLWQALRGGDDVRANARWGLVAVAGGVVLFVPWVPTFLYQSAHTGTPWAKPPNFAAVINAITGFTDNQATNTVAGSNQGRLLALCYFVLGGLGLFGLARDRWHVDLDLRTRARARPTAVVVGGTLVLAIIGAIVTNSAYSNRYAAVIFVPLVVLVALGTLTLVDVRVRTVVVAVAVVAGLASGVENISTQRSEAQKVATTLAAEAKPGDLVVFCPDQLGPSVARLLPGDRYRMTTYPRGTGPQFVDWVDYQQAIDRSSPTAFARHLQQEASASGANIWLVWYSQYEEFGSRCQTIAASLAQDGTFGAKDWVFANNQRYYEPMQLTQFAPLPPRRG